MKRTIWASVTVGLAALMTFGCGNVFDSSNGTVNSSNPVQFTPNQTAGNPFKIWAVDTAGQIFFFLSDNPSAISAKSNITGLPGGERIIALDCRPRTGVLYGITNTGKLFWIDKATFAATQIPGGQNPAQVNADIDFNPVVDRIRQEADAQNVRVHPGTGVVSADTPLTLQPANVPANIAACAYTNPEEAPATTTLFAISPVTNRVYRQGLVNPNDGQLFEVGQLPFEIGGNVGFDIAPGNIGFAAVQRLSDVGFSTLLKVDPVTGAATIESFIGGGVPVKSIAVDLVGPAVTRFVGIDTNKQLVRFNSNDPSTLISSNAITGIVEENIIACDFSPGGTLANGLKVVALPNAGGAAKIYSVNLTPGADFAKGTLVSTTTVNLPAPANLRFGADIIAGAGGGTMVITAATGTFSSRRLLADGSTTQLFSHNLNTNATTQLATFSGYSPALGFDKNFLGGGTPGGFGISFGQTNPQIPILQLISASPTGFGGVLSVLGTITTQLSELDIEPNGRVWFVGPSVEFRTAPADNPTQPLPTDSFSTLYQVARPALTSVSSGRIGGQPLSSFAIIPALEQNGAAPQLTEAP